MKKILVGFLCAATMMSAAAPAFAAEAPKVISPGPAAVMTQSVISISTDSANQDGASDSIGMPNPLVCICLGVRSMEKAISFIETNLDFKLMKKVITLMLYSLIHLEQNLNCIL